MKVIFRNKLLFLNVLAQSKGKKYHLQLYARLDLNT